MRAFFIKTPVLEWNSNAHHWNKTFFKWSTQQHNKKAETKMSSKLATWKLRVFHCISVTLVACNSRLLRDLVPRVYVSRICEQLSSFTCYITWTCIVNAWASVMFHMLYMELSNSFTFMSLRMDSETSFKTFFISSGGIDVSRACCDCSLLTTVSSFSALLLPTSVLLLWLWLKLSFRFHHIKDQIQ